MSSDEIEDLMKFPLIQLPRKSEVFSQFCISDYSVLFPLIQLPRKSEVERVASYRAARSGKVSINSTSEEVRSLGSLAGPDRVHSFPLIQLPRKSEVCQLDAWSRGLWNCKRFPLIQLPRKSEEWGSENLAPRGL